MQHRTYRNAAIAWFFAVTLLLCLPGSSLPQAENDWFSRVYFDKWVHVFLFGLLLWLVNRAIPQPRILSVLFGMVYGLAMEFVQKWLISGRSFEGWDIVADAAGCLLGYLLSFILFSNKQQH